MTKLSRHAARTRRGALGGLAAVLIISLAACGTVKAGAGPSSAQTGGTPGNAAAGAGGAQDAAGAALCASAGRVDRVVVGRTPGLPASGKPRAAQPGAVTVTNPLKVRALARALCGLSTMPHAPVNCPADFGGALRMVFSAAAREFAPVVVETSGCRTVTGLGPARVAGTVFWRTLTVTLGPHPVEGANP